MNMTPTTKVVSTGVPFLDALLKGGLSYNPNGYIRVKLAGDPDHTVCFLSLFALTGLSRVDFNYDQSTAKTLMREGPFTKTIISAEHDLSPVQMFTPEMTLRATYDQSRMRWRLEWEEQGTHYVASEQAVSTTIASMRQCVNKSDLAQFDFAVQDAVKHLNSLAYPQPLPPPSPHSFMPSSIASYSQATNPAHVQQLVKALEAGSSFSYSRGYSIECGIPKKLCDMGCGVPDDNDAHYPSCSVWKHRKRPFS